MPLSARSKVWLWYAAVWIPVGVIYAFGLADSQHLPAARAIPSAATNVVVPALLGVLVWHLTGRLRWPPKSLPRFVLAQCLFAVLFTGLWLLAETSFIALGAGWEIAFTIARTFAIFQALTGLWVYGVIAGISYLIRVGVLLREREAAAARADALRVRAELAALRGQLNPHFLFNTLHTLTALVRRDPATAEHALEQFGDMLRYVLGVKRAAREDVSLGEELAFVRTYLALEQLRLGDRLRVIEDIDADACDCVLPSLTLQPLVENAIKHGIAPRAAGGTLTLRASLEGDHLSVEVRDDGAGAAPATIAGAEGMGLRAVRQRLETRYPGRARVIVTTAPQEGFAVAITLPAHTGVTADPALSI